MGAFGIIAVALLAMGVLFASMMHYIVEPLQEELSNSQTRERHLEKRIDDLEDPFYAQSKLNQPVDAQGNKISYAKYTGQSLGIQCEHCGKDAGVTRKKADKAILQTATRNHGMRVGFELTPKE